MHPGCSAPHVKLAIALVGLPLVAAFAQHKDDFAGEKQQTLEAMSLEELLGTVVVTATKEEQRADEVPTIISVIGREQILQHNYQTVAEAIASLPGFFVNQDYVFRDIGVRGISGEMRGGSRLVKVMVDGHPISFRSENVSLMGPELIPMDAIERIEVIRGPESAFYGANAFLGVVNIITRAASRVNGASVAAHVSVFGGRNVGGGMSIVAGNKVGPVDLFVAYSRSREDRSGLRIRCTTAIRGEQACDNATSVTLGLLERASYDDIAQPASALAKVGIDLSAFGRVDIMGTAQNLDSRGSFSDWGTLTHTDGILNSGNRVALYNNLLRLHYALTTLDDRLSLSIKAAHARGGVSDTEKLVETSGTFDRFPYGFRGTDVSAEVRIRPLKKMLDAWTPPGTKWITDLGFLLGADHTQDNVSLVSSIAAPTHYETQPLHTTGFWGQLTGGFVDNRIQLLGGLRYDRNRGALLSPDVLSTLTPANTDRLCHGQVCYDQLSYGVGASAVVLNRPGGKGEHKQWLNKMVLKGFSGTSFQAPSAAFLYSFDFLGERPINPNPTLLPQNVHSQQLQLAMELWDRSASLSLTGFYNLLTNKAEFAKAGQAVVATNSVPTRSFGFEAEARVQFHPLSGYAHVSFQDSKRLLGNNPESRIEETFGYPPLLATVGGSLALTWVRANLNAEIQYTGPRTGHFFNRSDRMDQRYVLHPYALINLNLVSHRWVFLTNKETRVAFSVRNLLNTGYEFPGFQPYYRYDVPGTPRMLFFTVSQEL